MIEIGLMAALFFLLLTMIASYLLKASLKEKGVTKSVIEKSTLIAIGLPPISSVKAKLIVPGGFPQDTEKLDGVGKFYLYIVRASFYLAVLSLIIGIVNEL